MKTKIILLTLISGIVALGISGCKTTSKADAPHGQFIAVDTNGILFVAGNEVKPQVVAGTLSLAANIGASYEIKQDSNSRDYFIAVKALIDLAIAEGQYDPIALKNAMSTISVKELRDSASTQKTISTILDTYGQYFTTIASAKLNGVSPYLVPMLQGISDGLAQATAPQSP